MARSREYNIPGLILLIWPTVPSSFASSQTVYTPIPCYKCLLVHDLVIGALAGEYTVELRLCLTSLSLGKVHIDGPLFPQHVDFAPHVPPNALFRQPDIKVPYYSCEDKPHL